MLLMATSPGGRGGANVLATAAGSFPHLGAEVIATFSLPSFHDHFTIDGGISDPAALTAFETSLQSFKNTLS